MAIGMGLMIGFHYKENFNYPYLSSTVSEFWRRWHISLGSFFRDYVYIPLGGSVGLENDPEFIRGVGADRPMARRELEFCPVGSILLYFYRFGAAVPEQGVRQASWIRIPHLSG